MKKKAIFILFLSLSTFCLFSQDINLPDLTGRIVDLTNTLTSSEKNNLTSISERYENSTGNQMVVAFVNSTGGVPIEQYSIALAEKWEIGTKGKDNGLIIIVAKNDRKIRIEVGYGLEGEVTDLQSKLIIDKIITPFFRQNQYYTGIRNAMLSIASLTGANSEFAEETRSMKSARSSNISAGKTISTIMTIFIIIIFIVLRVLMGFGRGYSIRGRRNRNIFFGGGSGFGGFGRGGGGGFSGGGGSFGGGGASGSW